MKISGLLKENVSTSQLFPTVKLKRLVVCSIRGRKPNRHAVCVCSGPVWKQASRGLSKHTAAAPHSQPLMWLQTERDRALTQSSASPQPVGKHLKRNKKLCLARLLKALVFGKTKHGNTHRKCAVSGHIIRKYYNSTLY